MVMLGGCGGRCAGIISVVLRWSVLCFHVILYIVFVIVDVFSNVDFFVFVAFYMFVCLCILQEAAAPVETGFFIG